MGARSPQPIRVHGLRVLALVEPVAQRLREPVRKRRGAPNNRALRPLEQQLETGRGGVIEDQGVVAERHCPGQVREAPRIAAAHVALRHGMPALGDPGTDARERCPSTLLRQT